MKKILAVDDSLGWLNFHSKTLNEIYGKNVTIETASSAREGYDKVYNNLKNPFDLIISDLQMELDFEPDYAGEWFVQQIQKLSDYNNSKIILCSATYNIRNIAQSLNVECIPKHSAVNDINSYKLKMDEALNL